MNINKIELYRWSEDMAAPQDKDIAVDEIALKDGAAIQDKGASRNNTGPQKGLLHKVGLHHIMKLAH